MPAILLFVWDLAWFVGLSCLLLLLLLWSLLPSQTPPKKKVTSLPCLFTLPVTLSVTGMSTALAAFAVNLAVENISGFKFWLTLSMMERGWYAPHRTASWHTALTLTHRHTTPHYTLPHHTTPH